MIRRLTGWALSAGVVLATAVAAGATPAHAASSGVNDAACTPSAAHPYPVVFLHGLGANMNEDLNYLQSDVAAKGYCTFALTYGTYYYGPYVGGVGDVFESAAQIAGFVHSVLTQTRAPKVDIVGHSEGGFESLYVTKSQGIAAEVDKVVAIAPPAHGTTFGGLYGLAMALGQQALVGQAMTTFGCVACSQLVVGGSGVTALDSGPIAQAGVSYTVITSKYDEMVTPTQNAFVAEPGVVNEYVQDSCPNDPVGHIGEAYDTNVWNLVENALDPAHATTFACSAGSPG
jgi:triacylglycerol esterase/lipase EstA (alpha/beta hydrolase family)